MLQTNYPLWMVGTLLAGTLASGWWHGRQVNRWGQSAALQAASARLSGGLPQRLGPWELAKTHDLEEGVADVLQCSACLHGSYRNDQSGDTIVVALVAGPAGPVSVHTPEICYSAQNYEMAGERQRVLIQDLRGHSHALWQVCANSREPTRPDLRVFYSWSRGAQWEAPAGPRFAYAGAPLLYKLQVAGPRNHNLPPLQVDPCQDFLSHFLSYVATRLKPTSVVTPVGP